MALRRTRVRAPVSSRVIACRLRAGATTRNMLPRIGGNPMKHWLRSLCGAGVLLAAVTGVLAGDKAAGTEFDENEGNLLVVLRESPGSNKQDEELRPFGKIRAHLADGRE